MKFLIQKIARFLILVILVFNYFDIKAQRFDFPIVNIDEASLIVLYKLNFCSDSTNSDFLAYDEMFLFIGENISKFVSTEFHRYDTIVRGISSQEAFQLLYNSSTSLMPMTTFHSQILKGFPENKITYLKNTLDGHYKYEESLNIFKWELHNETMTIKGYNTQKASCKYGGREWIAWFTKDIPYNDGPYKFNGLPGLILKIYDKKRHYTYEVLYIAQPHKKTNIDFVDKNYYLLSKEEFFIVEESIKNGIVSRAKAAGLPKSAQQKAAMTMKKWNNPIELK